MFAINHRKVSMCAWHFYGMWKGRGVEESKRFEIVLLLKNVWIFIGLHCWGLSLFLICSSVLVLDCSLVWMLNYGGYYYLLFIIKGHRHQNDVWILLLMLTSVSLSAFHTTFWGFCFFLFIPISQSSVILETYFKILWEIISTNDRC